MGRSRSYEYKHRWVFCANQKSYTKICCCKNLYVHTDTMSRNKTKRCMVMSEGTIFCLCICSSSAWQHLKCPRSYSLMRVGERNLFLSDEAAFPGRAVCLLILLWICQDFASFVQTSCLGCERDHFRDDMIRWSYIISTASRLRFRVKISMKTGVVPTEAKSSVF